ncbi:hypothetical protein KUTeg_022414 [Tegillarca granosa]|uniref:Uncharacterized protein n=1 Tax=Tegillarca granosa TaxID=220873 RepID=A0ABQ9EBL4_TEGGR|nr:hypothetical protein KUTeg_022414 [Tegillarca granosa]
MSRDIKNGAVYIRSGRTRCPSGDTKLVYSVEPGVHLVTPNLFTQSDVLEPGAHLVTPNLFTQSDVLEPGAHLVTPNLFTQSDVLEPGAHLVEPGVHLVTPKLVNSIRCVRTRCPSDTVEPGVHQTCFLRKDEEELGVHLMTTNLSTQFRCVRPRCSSGDTKLVYSVTGVEIMVQLLPPILFTLARGGKTDGPFSVIVNTVNQSGPFYDNVVMYNDIAVIENSGANTQCLPKDPNWRRYHDGTFNDASRIQGAEYLVYHYSIGEVLHNSYNYYNVPCAVCQSKKRLKVHMIPAKDRCYNGWHLEYRGYLMTQRYDQGAANYLCVDARPEKIGSKAAQLGRLFYPVESYCKSGSLPCPPYVHGRELTCALQLLEWFEFSLDRL